MLERSVSQRAPPSESESSNEHAHRDGSARPLRPRNPDDGEGETEDELDDDASVRSSHGSRAPLSDGDFDASEMDRYFRARDDLIPRYPNLHPSHVRRRVPYAP